MNGKKFEEQFKKSISDDVFLYRLKDSTATFSNNNTSFAVHNISDFFAFYNNKLFFLELKCHKGKSLPFSCIRKTQINEMIKASKYDNIESYIVVNFYESNDDKIFFININDVYEEIQKGKRKSLSIEVCYKKAILVSKYKKRINEYYNLDEFFKK